MKKTAIAFAVAALATAAVQAAPQANTFYAGARAGWASMHNDVKKLADQMQDQDEHLGIHRNSFTYGLFGGYQITDNFAAELGYDYFGGLKYKSEGHTVFKMHNHGTSLTLKGSYPIIDGLDAYGRIGAALVRSDYKVKDEGKVTYETHSLKVSPVYAAGLEYAPIPELGLRLEYSWLNNVGKLRDEDHNRVHFAPHIGAVTFGASYRFGQEAPVAPVQVSQTFALNSDVTFGFGKATLKPQAETALNDIYAQIASVHAQQVTINGYTDRIGSAKGNLRLSKERAESVAKYLEGKGLPADIVAVNGYGSADPVVQCAKEHGKALIKCLAPNRRVQISVNGTK
ncbi:hypothetical protein A6A19_02470 [Actinobacillus delphinicola]|uniref:OmpA domain-containing protein n=1 Tax=Actinobacillus delphinicola TaxID=51161 RepID=A0A448TRT7_9PAST|nr:porin OmpA [Actinobacillus delphinicola]MDG6896891.1 hypothetical protein [Actinobacillus delphinicola]VEJ08700.1 OmpA domain-containing protein [Actinobacillus delphinicola]